MTPPKRLPFKALRRLLTLLMLFPLLISAGNGDPALEVTCNGDEATVTVGDHWIGMANIRPGALNIDNTQGPVTATVPLPPDTLEVFVWINLDGQDFDPTATCSTTTTESTTTTTSTTVTPTATTTTPTSVPSSTTSTVPPATTPTSTSTTRTVPPGSVPTTTVTVPSSTSTTRPSTSTTSPVFSCAGPGTCTTVCQCAPPPCQQCSADGYELTITVNVNLNNDLDPDLNSQPDLNLDDDGDSTAREILDDAGNLTLYTALLAGVAYAIRAYTRRQQQ